MNKKYNIELCRDYATKRNGLCLSEEYSGKKLLWKCNIGHIWGATYNDIFKSKSWCPECSPYKKLNGLKEAQEISDSRKGKCLSKEYKNIESKLLFECDRGHQWYASLGDLKRKNRRGWCPECIGKKKLTIKIAHEEARKKGGKCLSKEYRDNKSFLTWQCEKGHIWDAPLCEIKSHGTWCVYCNRGKITIESLKELAIRRKGLCLSSNYKYGEKLLWKCKKGHEWWANPSNLINGDCWCPECGRLRAAKKMRTSYIAYHWKTGEKLVCVGSYEIRVVNYFNERKIEYLWQPKTFFLPDKRSYRPDTYLVQENRWIEIKGYFRNDSKEKWNWFHNIYPNSELWNEPKLKAMGIIKIPQKVKRFNYV